MTSNANDGCVVFFAPPFRGHYHILYQAAVEWSAAHPSVAVHFVLCGWSNVPLPILPAEFQLPYTYLHASNLTSSDPNVFNADRAVVLESVVSRWLSDYASDHNDTPIHALAYDFFCWEVARVGEALRIPTYCSIPAIPPALGKTATDTAAFLQLCQQLASQIPSLTTKERERIALVSDGLYLPGSAGQWVWAPAALLRGSDALELERTLSLLGPHSILVQLEAESLSLLLLPPPHHVPLQASPSLQSVSHVYVSFGTVVTGNLFEQYPDAMKDWLTCIYRTLVTWTTMLQDLEKGNGTGITMTIAIPYRKAHFEQEILQRLTPSERCRVRIVDMCDQPAELLKANLFVTHGGGNSIREAIHAQCPVLVLPFFGDQWDTARHVSHADLGAACFLFDEAADVAMTTTTTTMRPVPTTIFASRPLNWAVAELQVQTKLTLALTRAWDRHLQRATRMTVAFNLNATVHANKDPIILTTHSMCDLPMHIKRTHELVWGEGDLLFGHNLDRQALASWCGSRDFHIGDTRAFSQLCGFAAAAATSDAAIWTSAPASAVESSSSSSPTVTQLRLPRLIDQYNDVLRAPALFHSERAFTEQCQHNNLPHHATMIPYLQRLSGFDAYLHNKNTIRPVSLDSEAELAQVWQMCLHGLDYFVQHHRAHIHFVISTFDMERNRATRLELEYLANHWERFRDHVTFYILDAIGGTAHSFLRRVGPPHAIFTLNHLLRPPTAALRPSSPLISVEPSLSASTDDMIGHQRDFETTWTSLRTSLTRAPFAHVLQPAWNGRMKAPASAALKQTIGRPVDDVFGFRLSYPYSASLYRIAAWIAQDRQLANEITLSRQMVWEDGKIIYLYGHTTGNATPCEIQLWPSVYLAAFQSEHGRIYKNPSATEAERVASTIRRKQQHALQQHIDTHAVLLSES